MSEEPTREESAKYWEKTVFDVVENDRPIETSRFVDSPIEELIKHIEGINAVREKCYDWSDKMLLNVVSFWKGKSVLDFGCGTGCESYWLSKHKPKSITLADIVPTNIQFASRVMSYACQAHSTVLWSSIEDLKNKLTKDTKYDGKYDIIYSPGVIHHIPDAKEVVKVLEEFLKDDGMFILMLYCGSLRKLYSRLDIDEKVSHEAEGPYAMSYDRKDVVELFGEGYKIVMEVPFNNGMFCLWMLEKVKK